MGRDRELSNDELITWILLGVGAVALIGNWGSVIRWAAGWLVANDVLVTDSVLVHVPGAGGAGLDAPRLAMAIGLLLALVAAAFARARLRHRPDETPRR